MNLDDIRELSTPKFDGYSIAEPVKFFFKVLVFAIAGVLAGGAVEKVVTLVPRDSNQHLKCAGLLLMQLTIISFLIVFFTQVLKINLYEWLNTDWNGRLFILTFFVAQGSLALNIACLFDIHYNLT